MTETATITVTPSQILEEWITDMETTDAPQAIGALAKAWDGEGAWGYCCLGRLCVVAARHGLVVDTGHGNYRSTDLLGPGHDTSTGDDETDTEIPLILAEWLGIEQNPDLDGHAAVDRNDVRGDTFATIAAAARREYANRLTTTTKETDHA